MRNNLGKINWYIIKFCSTRVPLSVHNKHTVVLFSNLKYLIGFKRLNLIDY